MPNFSFQSQKQANFQIGRKITSAFLKFSLLGFALTQNAGEVFAQTQNVASSNRCDGKLGVHRTITVSNKHTTLVGVSNHGRIGLRPKELVLTFDDGPKEGTTTKILEALAQECVKATFFTLGRAARAHPKLLQRVAKEGHTIATHTQSHPFLTRKNNEEVRAEIRRGINSANFALKGTPYKVSNFFRYPFLDRNQRTDAIVREKGLVAFHMNIDSWDWRKQTPQEMVQLTLSRVRAHQSGVVLFHDIQHKTAAGLPDFLRAIKKEGFKIVHVVPGESDFNFREDLIARKKQPKAKKVAAVSSKEAVKKPKRAKLTTEKAALAKVARAPHPKTHPLGGALRKTIRPVAEERQLSSLDAVNNPQSVKYLQPVQKRKKKRFGFFRKIFSKKSIELNDGN